MNAPSIIFYTTKSCVFCNEFVKSETPELFKWLIESKIPYELVKASKDYLVSIGISVVPALVYNDSVVDSGVMVFTSDNIIKLITAPSAPTFSGIPSRSS